MCHRLAPLVLGAAAGLVFALLAGACVTDGSIGGGDGVGAESCDVEGASEACYPGSPVTQGTGVCEAGTRTCSGGLWGACEGAVIPGAETCGDALDNNCNGLTDDGCACEAGDARPCYSGSVATAGIGACTTGEQACVDGVWSATCDGEVAPVTETCDGTDDDCDGSVDEGCPCDLGATRHCYSGPASTEGVGPCKGGTETCHGDSWSACEGEVAPSGEKCNGVDDDCDGDVDGGNPGGGGDCDTGKPGICGPGTTDCEGGKIVCNANKKPKSEACNGADDDCDGQVDEGNPGGGDGCTASAQGICQNGTTKCSGGSIVCLAGSPKTESCNGKDDNCDGGVDEGDPGAGASCTANALGECAKGTTACQGGSLVCVKGSAKGEYCNGKDDDCDGEVDDGNLCGAYKECVGGKCVMAPI